MTAQHNGPYIVRVGIRYGYVDERVVSLVAVEDLEAARRAARDEIAAVATASGYWWSGDPRWGPAFDAVHALPASGGSIDLPGGERITVEPTMWERLISESGWQRHDNAYIDGERLSARGKSLVLAAWNERCGIKRQEVGR